MKENDGELFISVADNGHGMNFDDLLKGMTYGSNEDADAKRLGKFGLGLKTASTAFCTKLSVISRDSKVAEIHKAIWDLEHVVDENEWELLTGTPSDFEIELLEEIAKDGPGTLVIWDNIDRLFKGKVKNNILKKKITHFSNHVGMIYQRFLDENDERAQNVIITINGEKIEAWDPFCVSEEGTKLAASQDKVKVAFSDEDTDTEPETESSFSLKAYVIPRKEEFSSPEAAKAARLGNAMQGFYIYRENRLIHWADWLGMFTKEPHGSLLRVEFSFDHTLDDAFHVDIKKSSILLTPDLYDWILGSYISGPRNAADERRRKGERTKISKQSNSAHKGSNNNISEKEADLKQSNIDIIDAENNIVNVSNKSGSFRIKLNIDSAAQSGEVCVKPVNEIQDGFLWIPALIDQHHAVKINTGHPYYSKVYVPNHNSSVTVQGMDSLLWALCEAELSNINDATKDHFEELRFEVSRLLRKLVEDLPEPEIEENNEN